MSESIDELMEGIDENCSNDTATKEIKGFKKAVIKSTDKFLSYIKLETKKLDIELETKEKGIEKKDTEKEHIKTQMIKIASKILLIDQLLMMILRHI